MYFSLQAQNATVPLSNSLLPQVKELAAQDELQSLLLDNAKFQQFKLFTMKQHCSESVLFYESVRYYKQLSNEKLDTAANHIFAKFINTNAMYEININDSSRKDLQVQ
jgi:Regulator of G protein signaling domain